MENQTRLALCVEYGAGKWRMLLLEPLEEVCVSSFPGQERGRWFKAVKDSQNGKWEFTQLEQLGQLDKLILKFEGLDTDICLKVFLPVTFTPSANRLGPSLLGGVQKDSAVHRARFYSNLDDGIKGPVLFDIDRDEEGKGIDRSVHYGAFVSLTSFNAPPAAEDGNGNEGQQFGWSIRAREDIIGPWNDKGFDSSKAKVEDNNQQTEADTLGAVTRRRRNCAIHPRSSSAVASGTSSRSRSRTPMSHLVGMKKEKEIEDQLQREMVLCWQVTNEDSFFLLCNNLGKLVGRIQANNKKLPLPAGVGTALLGGWYDIEYNRYKGSAVHVKVVKMVRKLDELPFETMLSKGNNLLFKILVERKPDSTWKATSGNQVIFEKENELNAPQTKCYVWCRLSPSQYNQFIFVSTDNHFNDAEIGNASPFVARKAEIGTNKVEEGEGKSIPAAGWTSSFVRNSLPRTEEEGGMSSPPAAAAEVQSAANPSVTQMSVNDQSQKSESSSPSVDDDFATPVEGGFGSLCKRWTKRVNSEQSFGAKKEAELIGEKKSIILNSTKPDKSADCMHQGLMIPDSICPMDSLKEDTLEMTTDGNKIDGISINSESEEMDEKSIISAGVLDSPATSLSSEPANIITKYSQIPRQFYPWIRGPYDKLLNEMIGQGLQIIFPVEGNTLRLKGEKETVEEFTQMINLIVDKKKRTMETMKCRVPREQQGAIEVDQVLEETDVVVRLPAAGEENQQLVLLQGAKEDLAKGFNLLCKQVGPEWVEEVLDEEKEPVKETSRLETILKNAVRSGRTLQTRSAPQPVVNIFNSASRQEPNQLEQDQTNNAALSQQQNQTAEKNRKNVKSGTRTMYEEKFNVPKAFHANIVGSGAKNLKKMETNHGVKINVPTEYTVLEQITISGPNQANVLQCKRVIVELVDRIQNQKWTELRIPIRLIPLIIGKNNNKLQKILVTFPRIEIDFPPLHQQQNEANYKLVSLRGPKDEVDRCRDYFDSYLSELAARHCEDFVPIPLDHPNHNAVEFIKFMQGKKSMKIKEINRQYPDVKICFPFFDEEDLKIRLDGSREQIEKVKMLLEAEIAVLKSFVLDFVQVDERLHYNFFKNDTKILYELKAKHPRCKIDLVRRECRVEIRGPVELVPAAKATVEEVVGSWQITEFVPVDPKYHVNFLKINAKLVRELQEEHSNCGIIFRKNMSSIEFRGRPEKVEAAKARVEGLLELMKLETTVNVQIPPNDRRFIGSQLHKLRQQNPRVKLNMPSGDFVTIMGLKEEVNKVEMALKKLFRVSESFEIPIEHRPEIIGPNGAKVKELERLYYPVQINVPITNQSQTAVTVIGPPDQVRICIAKIKSSQPVTRTIVIPSHFHGPLIGVGGELKSKMEARFDVKVYFPPKGENFPEVCVIGKEANAESCVKHIGELLIELQRKKEEKSFELSVEIPNQFHGKLIGTGGKVVQGLSAQYNVHIACHDNFATITGRREDCERCKADIVGRKDQWLRQYPPQCPTIGRPVPLRTVNLTTREVLPPTVAGRAHSSPRPCPAAVPNKNISRGTSNARKESTSGCVIC